MKKLILILVLFPIVLLAQNSKGIVLDKKSKLPIEAVNITLKQFEVNIITDEKGKFDLKFSAKPKENDTLIFSHISYRTKK